MVPMKKKQNMEIALKMWMSNDVFTFVICKKNCTSLYGFELCIYVCLLNYVMNLNYARSFYL
jgi:hypothetical protein